MRDLARSRDGSLRMAEVPRVVPFVSCRDAGDPAQPGDGMTLDGFASVFNSPTIIDSWEGRFKEQFLPGSMKRSFRDQTPIIQFDHGRHPMIGSLPVARFEAGYPREETDPERAPQGGARVLARMHSSPLFDPVREVISTGTVNGMSIRFGVAREKWYRADGSEIKNAADLEAELMRTWMEDVPDDELIRRDVIESRVAEMGPVVFPAYTTTSVGVRSVVERLGVDVTMRAELARELAGNAPFIHDLTRALTSRAANDPADGNVLTQALGWFTAIDSIVDEAQEALAAYLEVPSPDPDDADEAASVEPRRLRLPRTPAAASAPRRADGSGEDDERQAAASTRTTSRRQRADDDTLRLLGIIPGRKAGQS